MIRVALLVMLVFNIVQEAPGISAFQSRTLDQTKSSINSMKRVVDSLKVQIQEMNNSLETDTRLVRELRQALEAANGTISKQNSLINGFDVLYTVLTIIIVLITFGYPVLIYFLNIRPTLEEARRITERAEGQLKEMNENFYRKIRELDSQVRQLSDEVDKNLSAKLDEHLAKNLKQKIDQAIVLIEGSDENMKSNSVSYLTKLPAGDFADDQIFKIGKLLRTADLKQEAVEGLSRILSERGGDDAEEFFRTLVKRPKQLEVKNVRYDAYRFFVQKDLPDRVPLITQMILATSSPTEEYKDLLQWLTSYSAKTISFVLNSEELNTSDKIKRKEIATKISESVFDSVRKDIQTSLLYRLETAANSS